MSALKSITISSSHLLGNKEKKKIKKELLIILDVNTEYKLYKTKERISIIHDGKNPILFSIDDKNFLPTIKYISNNNYKGFKIIFLDNGALKPILSGANIMAPGIFKYKDKIETEFKENDYVFIKIDDRIIAIGIAILNLKDINQLSKGTAVNVIHKIDDAIDNFVL